MRVVQSIRTRFTGILASIHLPTMAFTLIAVAVVAAAMAVALQISPVQSPLY
jgi:hypothetical protein